jgi:hypothetical protein
MMGSHDIHIVIIPTHGWKLNQKPEIPKNKKVLRLAHNTTLPLFFPFCLLTKHQQNTNPNTTDLQAHKQIRQNSASLLEISQKEKRIEAASGHKAQEIGESMPRILRNWRFRQLESSARRERKREENRMRSLNCCRARCVGRKVGR